MTTPLQQDPCEPLQGLLEQARQLNRLRQAQGFEYTSTNVREALDLMTRRFVTRAVDIGWIHDTLVAGPDDGFAVPVRLYHPQPGLALPVMVFAHGGGHVAGSVSVYDPIARRLAEASGRVLLSVDYRLAPECPFPAALADLTQVVQQVYPTLERLRVAHIRDLALAGDSGGGALVASVVHRLADAGVQPIDHQVLIYPSLDYTLSCPSIDELAEGYLLERRRIQWLFGQYFRHDEDRRAASPLFMPVSGRLPRSLVVTAGWCPLRDEGMAYTERLRAAGRPVEALHFPDMIHAFANLEDLVPDACARLYRTLGDFLRPDPASSGEGGGER